MPETIRIADLPEFDASRYLDSDEAIAQYLKAIREEEDPALGHIARSRGMTEIARASGLTREALYRASRPNAQPRFDTVARVGKALGVGLVVESSRV